MKMRFNSRELAVAASLPNPDKEGKLAYKKPQKSTGFKDKWFRLKGNLLFYYSWDSISTGSTFDFSHPQGVIVLERIRVQHEPHHHEQSFVFSVSFENQEGSESHMGSHDYASVAKAKHYFAGRTLEECEGWVQKFRKSSTESLKSDILVLQAKILKLTGVDPLDAFFLNPKVDFRNTGGGLMLHHLVDIPNPSSEDLPEDADRTNTLTSDSSTLTPCSNKRMNEEHSSAGAAAFEPISGDAEIASPINVPIIVVEIEDESADAAATSVSAATSLEPQRPSLLAESQRLVVAGSGLGLSDSSSDSSPSGSPNSSPKIIKAAVNAEKKEKMPRKSAASSAILGAASVAAAAVQERLSMMTLEEEAVEMRLGSSGKEGAEEERPTSIIDEANADDNFTNEDKASPRAPPRHRTRSRKSNSMRKQLSLIEEEEKNRSVSIVSDELSSANELEESTSCDGVNPNGVSTNGVTSEPLSEKPGQQEGTNYLSVVLSASLFPLEMATKSDSSTPSNYLEENDDAGHSVDITSSNSAISERDIVVTIDTLNSGVAEDSSEAAAATCLEQMDKENLRPNREDIPVAVGGSTRSELIVECATGTNQTSHDPVDTINDSIQRNLNSKNVEIEPKCDVGNNGPKTDSAAGGLELSVATNGLESKSSLGTSNVDGPKPTPRTGHKGSLKLPGLLSAPLRPKRKSNLTKTKSSPAIQKTSSFRSFLTEDGDDPGGRESNA